MTDNGYLKSVIFFNFYSKDRLLLNVPIYDFLIKVVVEDMESYQKFALYRLSNIPNIDHVQSSFVLSNDKYTTAYNL
ncbi:Lrp/AsnC ligand binding domain-containing protein [Flavobacterium flavipallidum]|uniref:Lrp/AsnC ligand binding domain-containing protein n=1 Tax=Flavobacterium flavipallidum TaxID=3139140 RepID=A0ABU9HMN5_9FLAO